jgi:hypothetical protein
MQALGTRRRFLKISGLIILSAGLPLSFSGRIFRNKPNQDLTIRIRPENARSCPPAFLRFCKRARFASPEKAVAAMRHHRQPYVIYTA